MDVVGFSSALQEVLLLFQEAALLNVDGVDPDLQTGLGVLYNLSSEFDKAVEAFSAALSARPQVRLLLVLSAGRTRTVW